MECSYFILNTMKLLSKLSLPFIFFTAILTLECAAQDWPNLNRYRDANKAIMEMRKNDSEDARKNWVVSACLVGSEMCIRDRHKIGLLWIRNSFPKMTTSEEESADKPALKCFCDSDKT